MVQSFSLREKHGFFHAVISYKDTAGKYRTKSISTHIPAIKGNRRKAEAKGKELIAEWQQREAESQREERITVLSDAITSYLKDKDGAVQPNTLSEYKKLGKLVLTLLDDTPINIINDETIKGLKAKLKGRNATDNTIRHYLVFINSVLQYAEQQGYELSSPGYHAETNKPPKYKGSSWYSVDEVRALLSAADSSDIRIAVYLAAYLGLRRSEILGLKWENVNTKDRIIKICEKRIEYSNEGKTIVEQSNKMKTEYSDRVLPLPEALCEVLEAEPNKSSYVVTDAKGKPLAPQYLTKKFTSLLERHGLRKIRFHDLRHTCASLLLQSGVDMKTVQTILGHGNYSTTADIYSHVDLDGKRSAMDKFSSNFL